MSDEPTQTTDEGLEIPVPKRGDVFDVLRRAAKLGKIGLQSGCEPAADEAK